MFKQFGTKVSLVVKKDYVVIGRFVSLVYQDMYVYTNHFGDFIEGFEIVKKIFDAVHNYPKTKGVNFNRYGIEGEDRLPHITIRFGEW